MLRFYSVFLALLVSLGVIIPAQAGLIIDPTFDSSITNDPNVAVIENSIDTAIAVFETTYSTPITVPIYFQEGGGLGESEFFYYTVNYQTFYNHLVSTDANPAAIAGLTANGGNNVDNPVTHTSKIDIKSAEARALGFSVLPGCMPTGSPGSMGCNSGTGTGAVDGIISLNTNITYPPQPNNGSNYGLLSTAEHEIDEILGLGSSLPDTNSSTGTATFGSNNPAPEDLFRYTAGGALAGTVNCALTTPVATYFS